MHYEVELGLVMGKKLRDLDEHDEEGAMGAISSKFMWDMKAGLWSTYTASYSSRFRHVDSNKTMLYQTTSLQST